MKTFLLASAFVLISLSELFSQCTPDTITDPGIYPDTLENLLPAFEGVPYSSVIQIRVFNDTTGPIGTVYVDSIILNSVAGFPVGFTYACYPSWCAWKANHNGCILLSGSPAIGSAGDYLLTINTTLIGKLWGLIPFSQAGTVDGYRIRIYPKPTADFSSDLTSVCKNDSVQFFDNSTNNPTQWNWTFSGASPSSSTLQNPKVKYIGSGLKSVTLTATNPAGNNTLTKTNYITINPLPAAGITLSGNDTICQLDTAVLTATAGIGFTYQWYDKGIALAGETAQTYAASETGNYSVKVTNANGCSRISAAKKIKVLVTSAFITPSGPVTICAGDSATLYANTGADHTYKWLKNGVVIPGATSSSYIATTAGTYKVKVTRSGICSKLSSGVKVKVTCREENQADLENNFELYPNPANDFVTVDAVLAESQNLKISLHDITGRYVATLNESFFSAGNHTLQFNVSNLSDGLYFIQFESQNMRILKRISVQQVK